MQNLCVRLGLRPAKTWNNVSSSKDGLGAHHLKSVNFEPSKSQDSVAATGNSGRRMFVYDVNLCAFVVVLPVSVS